MNFNKCGIFWVLLMGIFLVSAKEQKRGRSRDSKLLPIFQVIRFPNDGCAGGSRNGTCYTIEECSARGGKQDGSCASGFGVCCVFVSVCGSTVKDNCSYLVQPSITTGLQVPCTYTVCNAGNNICRIRYDFTIFQIAGPVTGSTVAAAAVITNSGAIGHCNADTFKVTTPGGMGSPVICGINTGYHMIVDASQSCQSATFTINGNNGVTRQWDIKVTQFACGDTDISGPPGCLQYYKDTSGVFQSFNFPVAATAVLSTATHLVNQKYQICIRRGLNFCHICYSPTFAAITALIAQISFGLSASAAPAAIDAKSDIGTACTTDYITIPNGLSNTEVLNMLVDPALVRNERFCGRYLNVATNLATTITVCSRTLPFRIGVVTDGTEVTTAADMATTNEQFAHPGGITGFQLTYFQVPC